MTMRRSHIIIMVLLSVSYVTGTQAANNIRYVNDHLIITLRTGQGDQFRILKSLPSGTRLELLEEVEGSDFAKVRTEDGTEGWVRSWYLRDTPTAKLQLEEATRKATKLAAENKKLLANNKALQASKTTLEKQLRELSGKHERLSGESERLKEVASRPIELQSENKRLTAKAAKLESENTLLSSENDVLRQSSVQKWFMTGSGVLIVGILLGLILPKLRKRRSSSGW